MKKLSNLLICFSCILFLGACSDDDDKNPLQGTKWKLEGYSIDGSDLKIMQPSDCEKCYTLSFTKSNAVGGWGSVNSVGGDYRITKEKMMFQNLIFTEVGDISDESFYFDLIEKTNKFQSSKNNLYLYSENKTSFLLFKSIAP